MRWIICSGFAANVPNVRSDDAVFAPASARNAGRGETLRACERPWPSATMKARSHSSLQPLRRLRRRGTGVNSMGPAVTSTRPITAGSGHSGNALGGLTVIRELKAQMSGCRKARTAERR
jgi:hypothetical protein